MKTVLMIDSDLGFLFWLGRALYNAHHQAVPATTVADAVSVLDQLILPIDVLIVNPSLPGSESFIKRLRRSYGHLKVIALTGESEETKPRGVDVSKCRPSKIDKYSESDWIDLVETTGVYAETFSINSSGRY